MTKSVFGKCCIPYDLHWHPSPPAISGPSKECALCTTTAAPHPLGYLSWLLPAHVLESLGCPKYNFDIGGWGPSAWGGTSGCQNPSCFPGPLLSSGRLNYHIHCWAWVGFLDLSFSTPWQKLGSLSKTGFKKFAERRLKFCSSGSLGLRIQRIGTGTIWGDRGKEGIKDDAQVWDWDLLTRVKSQLRRLPFLDSGGSGRLSP